jgi:hypothetical protein
MQRADEGIPLGQFGKPLFAGAGQQYAFGNSQVKPPLHLF